MPRSRNARTVVRRAVAGLSALSHRAAADGWLLLQATVGATAAWLVAHYLLGHPEPYFAPIAAISALNSNPGERGLNAVQLLQGVLLGLLVGELALATLGSGAVGMALAVFVTLATARAMARPPVVVIQAAVTTVLVVAVGNEAQRVPRLLDVVIGASITLVLTQLLFPPEPLALLRRAERAALTVIADGLVKTANAVAQDDNEQADRAVADLRDAHDRLTELRRVRRASTHVTRRALTWRARAAVVVREKENAGHLDPLSSSCLLLARLLAATNSDTRSRFEQPVRDLAGVIASLARELGDRETRQHAADRSLELANSVEAQPADPELTFLAYGFRLVATDVIAFAGANLADAVQAVREGALERRVPPPVTAPGRFLGWIRRLRGKTRR